MLYLTQRVDMDQTPVRHLQAVPTNDPAEEMFVAMLSGWTNSMHSRGLATSTVRSRRSFVRRFQRFLGEYPWSWKPADVEDFTAHLISGPKPLSHSTLRGFHLIIRLFCDYLIDPAYDWQNRCLAQFDDFPIQICHEWNTHRHLADIEARPARRPFTYEELQLFFDTADKMARTIQASGRKGALSAYRDAQFFKTVYAYGLRRREAIMLDTTDLHHNPEIPQWENYGQLRIRHGKALKGSPKRQRTVLSLPEFDWAIQGLQQWTEEIRPLLNPNSNALWITERKSRLSARAVNERFANIKRQAGLEEALTPHSLRHSYVTHLVEHGYAEHFIQEQVGHSYASTTAIYTSVSNDYKNRILRKAYAQAFGIDDTKEPQ